MKGLLSITGIVLVYMVFALSWCAQNKRWPPPPTNPAAPMLAEAKKPPAKAPAAKVKPVKASGDIGLLDLEKNYMILVTKEGKLITADFNNKTKVQKLVPGPSKMSFPSLVTRI